MLRTDGAVLLRVTFVRPQRYVDESDDYCDAREYWYIRGQERILVTRDCAEQWGADSQGPVDVSFDGRAMTLEYLEWQSSDGCERTVASPGRVVNQAAVHPSQPMRRSPSAKSAKSAVVSAGGAHEGS